MEAAAVPPPRALAWVALGLVAAAFALALAGTDRVGSTATARITPVIVASDGGSRQAIVRALVIAAGPNGTPGYLGSSVRERRRLAAASAATTSGWTGGRSFRGEP